MNPITSTVAASCNRLVPKSPLSSPRGSPRSSPRHSPVTATKFSHMLSPPGHNHSKDQRRGSRETDRYKMQLASQTSKAYQTKKNETRKPAQKGKASAAKDKPQKRLLEEAVAAPVREKKTKTTNRKASGSREKQCTLM